jgi:hypothetical protein
MSSQELSHLTHVCNGIGGGAEAELRPVGGFG